MIGYIKGTLEIKSIDYIIVDVNGIGYKIFMSKSAINEIVQIGKIIKVYTYLKVREDDISLYGFNSNEELSMFELLLSVGGIGAKSAITILSNITPSKFALAIISNDINTLKTLQGIGPKTAQRIILELKDKIKTEDTLNGEDNNIIEQKIQNQEEMENVVQALQVLGYRRYEINNILPKLKSKVIEEQIKEALQYLAK